MIKITACAKNYVTLCEKWRSQHLDTIGTFKFLTRWGWNHHKSKILFAGYHSSADMPKYLHFQHFLSSHFFFYRPFPINSINVTGEKKNIGENTARLKKQQVKMKIAPSLTPLKLSRKCLVYTLVSLKRTYNKFGWSFAIFSLYFL